MYFLKYDKLIVLIYVKMISNGGYNMHYKAVKEFYLMIIQ